MIFGSSISLFQITAPTNTGPNILPRPASSTPTCISELKGSKNDFKILLESPVFIYILY